MPLERVLMFDYHKGWVAISVKEASVIHPGGTVSARSGLFMCDKCHQYVYFADGEKKGRYFGHSRGDNGDKECKDRSKNIVNSYDPQKNIHSVFKIEYSRNELTFYIGLILPNPTSISGIIDIIPSIGSPFTYNLSRFGNNTFAYFNVGNYPARSYKIDTKKLCITSFPSQADGVSKDTTVFDKKTGKKLPEWSSVQVRKSYLMLCKGKYLNGWGNITHDIVSQINGFTLYEINADEFSKSASEFFYRLNLILTSYQSKLYPLWPIYKKARILSSTHRSKCLCMRKVKILILKLFLIDILTAANWITIRLC